MTGLTFKALRETSLARCRRWHPGGVADWSLSDWATATAGEMGEACNVVKKLNRERDGIVGNNLALAELRAQLGHEIADTLIYLDLLAAAAGIDLAAAVVDKFNIVSERNGFPERLGQDAAPGFWYLATQYAKHPDGFEAAYRDSCQAAATCMRHGFPVFSPIAHSHSVSVEGPIELEHSEWLAADRPFMAAAVGAIVLTTPGWGTSVGIAHEIDFFKAAGKPVLWMDATDAAPSEYQSAAA